MVVLYSLRRTFCYIFVPHFNSVSIVIWLLFYHRCSTLLLCLFSFLLSLVFSYSLHFKCFFHSVGHQSSVLLSTHTSFIHTSLHSVDCTICDSVPGFNFSTLLRHLFTFIQFLFAPCPVTSILLS